MNQQNSDGVVLSRREVPKVGGSSAGFIVLIVALCLIILISVIAIYFLLRDERISDEELPKRHKAARKARYGIPADDARLRQKFWHPMKHRLSFFTRTNKVREGHPVQLVDDLQPQAPQLIQINRMTSPDKRDSMLTGSTSYGSNIRSLASPVSASSIRFDTPGIRISLPPERDRFPPSPSASPSHMHRHLSTPPLSAPNSPTIPQNQSDHSVLANMFIAPTVNQSPAHGRDVTLGSTVSSGPKTFEGGSRFFETF